MIAINENKPTGTKRKRVSKKLKSSWRKHVDLTDVDNFLEEQRLTERLGDYAKLSNNELFTLDTQSVQPTKLTSKQAYREKLRNAPLKCLSLLQPLTKVPDPIAKRNRVRTKEERQHPLIKQKQAKLKAQGIFKKSDLERVKNMQLERERREAMEKEGKFDFSKDIWSNNVNTLLPHTKTSAEIDAVVANDEWIQGAERHIRHGPGKLPKGPPKSTHKKPYLLNAIELPHPGMSYNPSYEDHQDLLNLIAEKEKKIIKEEEHLKRVTELMFKKVTPAQRDANWLVEMTEGLKPDISNEGVNEDDEEYKPINPPVKNKEKSTKQRRKQREQQQLLEKLHQAKIEKKKVSDLYRLKVINKEIDRAAKKTKKLQEKRLKKQEYQKYEAKRLGLNKYEEPDMEFNMKKDISGNLRNLKKEGNLLNDRFKSLQKRNIIAPSIIKNHKKAKVKEFVKNGYKEDTWKAGLSKKLS
ncbi:LOW QUALITY PROTEIN: ribosome biogenesis protein NOP53 [Atheta coriaria]|uniref:LOW QUALITY PROTEIN: ribosome biogenesis protein NOP53 n=1 Tax=Dalotia coriaria TaxID=877792 RepID=UPI0031F45440